METVEQWPAMPADAQRGFDLYAGPAGRNAREVARLLRTSPGTVASWSSRYRWGARVAAEDGDARDGTVAAARARLARSLPLAVETIEKGMKGELDEKRGPVQLRAAFGTLDRFGLSPIQHATLDVTSRRSDTLPVSTEELSRLAAVGDVATLLALASGRPLPDPDVIDADSRTLPAPIAAHGGDVDPDDDDGYDDDDATCHPPSPPQGGRQDFIQEVGRETGHPEPDSAGGRAPVSFGGSGRRWGLVSNPRQRPR